MRTPSVAFAAALAFVLLLAGCSAGAPRAEQGQQSDIVARYGLTGLDAKQVIERLDTTPITKRPEGLQASIRPDELVLMDASGAEERMPMPSDEVYVAFAPYTTGTHECTFHAPNSCVGELRDAVVSVTIIDATTGEVYADAPATTYDNGFIGYWLPRGVVADVRMSADQRTAVQRISTRGADALTCITTLQLS